MATTLHTLLIGPSRDGEFVHPADADFEGVFTNDVEEAKAAAEEYAGRRLDWRWLDSRQVLRATTGPGQAAEISTGTRLERIDVDVAPM